MEELKTCPFCGGEPLVSVKSGRRYDMISFLKCETCGASTRAFTYYSDIDDGIDFDDSGVTKAIRAWNRRTEHE